MKKAYLDRLFFYKDRKGPKQVTLLSVERIHHVLQEKGQRPRSPA
jgi:hypothetical protein